MVQAITPQAASALLASNPSAVLLDVREPWETQLAAVNQPFVAMPMQLIPQRFSELPSDAPIICLCHHGMRSMQVAHFLERQQFGDVYNLSGGIEAWAQSVDSSVVQY
jgi:rhodanese-related sulfurtransferase